MSNKLGRIGLNGNKLKWIIDTHGHWKKSKSWGPFWSYQLKSTANLANLAHFQSFYLFLCIIRWGRNVSAKASPVGMNVFARFTEQLVSMGTKVITLGLDQIGREFGSTIAVIKGQGCWETGSWDTKKNSLGNNLKKNQKKSCQNILSQKVECNRYTKKGQKVLKVS